MTLLEFPLWLSIVSMRMQVQSLALLTRLGSHVATNYSIGHRCGSDLEMLWLWHRPSSSSSDLTPSMGTSVCTGTALNKNKQINNNFISTQVEGIISYHCSLWISYLCSKFCSDPCILRFLSDLLENNFILQTAQFEMINKMNHGGVPIVAQL